ncbi:PKD domain-containing protein [Bacterioplanes sanyensis]|nr:PKD domain-containing protein [Bacterioplanes sanyensis]
MALGLSGVSTVHATEALHPQWVKVAQEHEFSADYQWESGWNNSGSHTLTIDRAGASFIKVHFDQFQLPAGMTLVVSNSDGSEQYRYAGHQPSSMQKATHASSGGFAAMSVSADRVHIRVEGTPTGNDSASVSIGHLQQGFSELELSSGPDMSIMSTCGIMERRDVMCWANSHPTEFERSRPTAKLLFGGGVCTAWRVGEGNRVMTNNHCISSANDVANAEVWFNYQHTDCNGNSLATVTKVTGAQLLATDYELDFTLFTVNNFEQIQSFGHYGLDVREPVLGEGIFIPQHGAGNPKELSIESDKNSSGQCEIDVAVTGGRGSNTDTGYLCDTIGGSSGSPVLADSSNKVIALHHFGGCPNQGVLIDRIWPKISTFFDGIPDNDGGDGGQQAPIANFSVATEKLTAVFNNQSSDRDGTIESYAWDFGDGNTATDANPRHTYAMAGDYDVSLTVTDNDGLTDTSQQRITVQEDDGIPLLNPGETVSDLALQRGEWLMYKVKLPAAASNLSVRMSGGYGDADLYLRAAQQPDRDNYDCRPYSSGNNEACDVASPTAEYYYVGIRAFRSFSGVSLLMTHQ